MQELTQLNLRFTYLNFYLETILFFYMTIIVNIYISRWIKKLINSLNIYKINLYESKY